jgi:RNA polymerase sigma-70 factor (ECF subfamily)
VASNQNIEIAEKERFQTFYDLTARPLFGYLVRVSGNRDAARDLLQESYCRYLSATLPAMDDAGRKNYLYRIATNLLNDRWRRGDRGSPNALQDEAYEDNLHVRVQMRDAFQKLQERERQLLWLAYVEGATHKEIAAISGIRTTSVRELLYRARRKLASVMEYGQKAKRG